MRTSAADIKGQRHPPFLEKPKEGTAIRELFDLFNDNPGTLFSRCFTYTASTRKFSMLIEALRTTYQMDIRCFNINRHYHRGAPSQVWCLVGTDIGRDYVDYFFPVWQNSPQVIIDLMRVRT